MNNFISCPDCKIRYCSENCRLEAYNKYHATLCLKLNLHNQDHPLNQLNEAWKTLHYPPETCSIMLIARILAMMKQSDDMNAVYSKLNDFQALGVNHDLMIFHKILGENFSNDLMRLYDLTKKAFPDAKLESVSLCLSSFEKKNYILYSTYKLF